MDEVMLHGGLLIAKMLKQEGVEVVFTLSGGHIAAIYDGCVREGIRVMDTRHEQVAVHAAEGWAKVTRTARRRAADGGPRRDRRHHRHRQRLSGGQPGARLRRRGPRRPPIRARCRSYAMSSWCGRSPNGRVPSCRRTGSPNIPRWPSARRPRTPRPGLPRMPDGCAQQPRPRRQSAAFLALATAPRPSAGRSRADRAGGGAAGEGRAARHLRGYDRLVG